MGKSLMFRLFFAWVLKEGTQQVEEPYMLRPQDPTYLEAATLIFTWIPRTWAVVQC